MVIQRVERPLITLVLKKTDGKLETEALKPTLFVPMTGAAEERRRVQPDPSQPTINNGDFEEVAVERVRRQQTYQVAEEEKQIRQNPVARTTDLLQKVFGALKR